MKKSTGNRWSWTLAGVVLLISCSAGYSDEADELTPIRGVVTADFALPDIAGNIHRLSDYSERVVLVTFWASWCPQCLWEMPTMERLWRSLRGEGLILLAINVGEAPEYVATFAESNKLSFPVLLDRDLAVYKEWPLLGLPTSFLLDRHGRPVYEAVGALDWQDAAVVAKIRDLLQLPTAYSSPPQNPNKKP